MSSQSVKPFGEVLNFQLKRQAARSVLLTVCVFSFLLFAAFEVLMATHIYKKSKTALDLTIKETTYSDSLSTSLKNQLNDLCRFAACENIFLVDSQTNRVLVSIPDEYNVGATAFDTPSNGAFQNTLIHDISLKRVIFEITESRFKVYLSVPTYELVQIPILLLIVIGAAIIGFSVASGRASKKMTSLLGKEIATIADIAAGDVENRPTFLTSEGNQLFDVINKQKMDLIRLKEAEAEVKRAELARKFAHNIRKPLNTLAEIYQSTPELAEEKRSLIKSVGDRIQYESNKVLEEHRLETRKDAHPGEPGVKEMLENLLREKKTGLKKNIKFQLDVEHEFKCRLPVKNQELETTLSNLLDNSIDAMDKEQGLVSVAIRKDTCPDESLLIQISDNGAGIDPLILPKLTKKGATFGKKNGNGLGLYYAHDLVTTVGGEIKISSRPKEGTQITLKFPLGSL